MEEIAGQKFPLMVLSQPGSALYAERWTPAIAEAIQQNYECTAQVADRVLCRPSATKAARAQ